VELILSLGALYFDIEGEDIQGIYIGDDLAKLKSALGDPTGEPRMSSMPLISYRYQLGDARHVRFDVIDDKVQYALIIS
jgi:hypothetical protein